MINEWIALVKKVEFSVHDVDSEKPVAGAIIIVNNLLFIHVSNENVAWRNWI